MSRGLEAAIQLTIPDNTAYTVLVELRRLGYADLERVERTELLHLTLSAAAAAPEEIVAALQHAEVVYNPNKHRLSYVAADIECGVRAQPADDECGVRAQPADSPTEGRILEFEAVIADLQDDTGRLVALLQRHFGITELQSLSRATAWTLHDRRGPASRERLQWACDQLLCNPRSQSVQIRRKPERIPVRELKRQAANERGQ